MGLKATKQKPLRKPSTKEKHPQPTVDTTNKEKQTDSPKSTNL